MADGSSYISGASSVSVSAPRRGTNQAMETMQNAAARQELLRVLGTELPIVQAPMGWIARAQLASAVSNAGGMGIIETSSGELDLIREEIRKSWDEYVAQVGEQLARSTPYFREALNEILARGQQVF